MKMMRLVVYILVLGAVLAGCSEKLADTKKKGDIILREVKVSEKDKMITETLSDHSFLFDVERGSKTKLESAPITIELYENGKFKQNMLDTGLSDTNPKDKIRLLVASQSIDDSKHFLQKWVISSMNDGGYIHAEGTDSIGSDDSDQSMSTIYSNLPLTINKGEKKSIAAIVSTKKNGIATGDLEAVLKDPKAASKFDRVYLIRMAAE